jgi:hypothetical protein
MQNKFKYLLSFIYFLNLNAFADGHLSISGADFDRPVKVDLTFHEPQKLRFEINSKFWKYCTSEYVDRDSMQALSVQCYTDEKKGKDAIWAATGCNVKKDRPFQSSLMILNPDGAIVQLTCTYKTN